MKKRIFTFLFTVLFLASSVLMTACNIIGGKTDETGTVSAKELFMDAINANEIKEIMPKDAFEAFKIVGSYETTSLEETEKAELDILVNKAGNLKGNLITTQLDESVKLELLTIDNNGYIKLPEVSDVYIQMDSEQLSGGLGIGIGDEIEDTDNESLEKAKALAVKLVEIFQSDALDSLYNAEMDKEFEIDGTTLNGNILTFAVTDQDVKNLYGEVSELEGIEFNLSVKLVVSDEVVVGAHINGGIGFEEENVKYNLPFEISYNGNNAKGNFTVTEGEKDILTADFTNVITDGKSDITVKANIISEYESEYEEEAYSYTENSNIEIKYTESEADKAGEGYISISAETKYNEENSDLDNTGAFKLPFTFNTLEDGTRVIEINKLEIEMMGVSVGIDMEMSLSYKLVENGINVAFDLAIDNQMLSTDMSCDFTITKAGAFEVAAPESYITIEDVNEEFLTKLEEKYPLFYEENFGFSDDLTTIEIDDDGVYYTFELSEGIGSMYSEYSVVSNDGEKAVIQLANGEQAELRYSQRTYSEEFDWYTLTINGMPYTMEVFSGEEYGGGEDCYYILSENFDDEASLNSQFVGFECYPESEEYLFNMSFSFNVEGDEYTLFLPDGRVKVVTISYDTANQEYVIS